MGALDQIGRDDRRGAAEDAEHEIVAGRHGAAAHAGRKRLDHHRRADAHVGGEEHREAELPEEDRDAGVGVDQGEQRPRGRRQQQRRADRHRLPPDAIGQPAEERQQDEDRHHVERVDVERLGRRQVVEELDVGHHVDEHGVEGHRVDEGQPRRLQHGAPVLPHRFDDGRTPIVGGRRLIGQRSPQREAVDRDPLEESPSLRRAPHRVERRFHDEDQSNRRHDQGHEADSGDGGRLGDELPQALGQLRRVVRQDAVDHLQNLVVLLFEESGEKQRKRREQGNGRQERSERERSREVRPAVGREAAKRVRDDLAHRHQDAEELLGHHRRACLCALDNHGDVPFRLSLVAIARFVHRPDHRLALTLARSPLLLRGGRPSNRASTG